MASIGSARLGVDCSHSGLVVPDADGATDALGGSVETSDIFIPEADLDAVAKMVLGATVSEIKPGLRMQPAGVSLGALRATHAEGARHKRAVALRPIATICAKVY